MRLTDLVKNFIQKFTDGNTSIPLDRNMLLNYMESQMLSHANGYMWYANSGAWGDINGVIIDTDFCIIFLLESILTMFKMHKVIEQTNDYKSIINVVRNGIKKIRELCKEKITILNIPSVVI